VASSIAATASATLFVGIDSDEHLHKIARTSVSVGPLPLAREGHSYSFGCSAPIPLSSHSAPFSTAGRKPRTSQPTLCGRQEVRERSLN
jgi:hypothetical protein